MHRFKQFVFAIILLLLLVLGTLSFIAWKYSDQLKAYAMDTLRSVIITDTSFDDDVRVSIWSDFPHIAVELTNVRIQDSFRKDTLIHLEKAFVQFDIWQLLRDKVAIEGIRLSNGTIKLRRDPQDQWNFHVWKQPQQQGPDTHTDLSIEVLVLEKVHLDYDDRSIDLNIQFYSDKSKIRGRFTDTNQKLGLSLNGELTSLTTSGADRIVQLPLMFTGLLHINNQKNVYTIETGNAILAGNEMVLSTEWRTEEDGTWMDLSVHAGNLDPAELLPKLWPQMPQAIKELQLRGRTDLIFSLSGPFNLNSGPELDATVRMHNGSLLFRETKVSDLNFESRVHMKDIKRSKAMQLTFSDFSLSTPSGKVKGSGVLTDLSDPILKLSTNGSTQLEELTRVAGITDELTASGSISWNIDFNGPLGPEFNTTVKELKQMNWSGSISLTDAALHSNRGIPPLTSVQANISMNEGRTRITECSGNLGHLAFDGDAEIALLKQILTDEHSPIELTGRLHVKELDVTRLPEEWQFETSSTENGPKRDIRLTVDATFDRIVYNKFTASGVSGQVVLEKDEVRIPQLKLLTLGGKAEAELSYRPEPSGYLLELNSRLQNIDMARTLEEWDEFGQTSITHNNLKGTANATLWAEIHLTPEMQMDMTRLVVESDVEIVGGELIEFEPLLAMSRFIDVEELNHVRFDTLRNKLSIRDQRLVIPRMTVASNILNVQVFGEHGFNQEMDYHVNLLLNDLLRRKQKNTRTFDGHEIIDEKGKTRLFLWIRGKPDNLKVGFDKREVRKKLKDDLKTEGQTIKQLFKEEFSGNAGTTTPESEVHFRLEDNGIYDDNAPIKEQDHPDQQKNTGPSKEKPRKKGIFSAEPDKTETEGEFEIEFDP